MNANPVRSLSTQAIQSRLALLMLGVLTLGGAILLRAGSIQVVGDQRLQRLANRQFRSKMLVTPKRGNILDRNGEALAVNTEVMSLAANPSKLQERKKLHPREVRNAIHTIAKALGLPASKLEERLLGKHRDARDKTPLRKDRREFVWLKRHLGGDELEHLKRTRILTGENELPDGFWMVRENQRIYPHNELAAHVLGSVNLDSEGIEGVELWKNESLRGKVASVSAVRDALGRPTFIDETDANEMRPGESSKLTLDATLQFSVEQELQSAMRKTQARAGTVIVMDPESGEVVAMANEPSFNPNHSGVSPNKRRNRALTDGYEPGSVVKPIILAGALKKGWQTTDKIYGEKGAFFVQGKRISEAESHERFEWINLEKMIQVSSNVVAAKLALKLGYETVKDTLQTFGFGSKTKSAFPGEISGLLPRSTPWTPLTTANTGFGQAILATSMQVVRAYSTFANGGNLVQPKFFLDTPMETPKKLLDKAQAEKVGEVLTLVTKKGGTGTLAAIDGLEIAGKTGTAQAVDPETGRYSKNRYVASFVGFARNVSPRYVVLVVLDEPHGVGGYYASTTAAPLFREVYSAIVSRYGLLPASQKPLLADVKAPAPPRGEDEDKDKNKDKAAEGHLSDELSWSLASIQGEESGSDPSEPNRTPSELTSAPELKHLRGKSAREALSLLQGQNWEVEMVGNGVVLAAERTRKGVRIRLGASR